MILLLIQPNPVKFVKEKVIAGSLAHDLRLTTHHSPLATPNSPTIDYLCTLSNWLTSYCSTFFDERIGQISKKVKSVI